MDLFFNNQRSRDKELELLKRFLSCLRDIDTYLDKYDEFAGLVFYEDDPIECLEKLRDFLSERYEALMDDKD